MIAGVFKMPTFSSNAVSRIEYDAFRMTLYVWFRNGAYRYAYEGVPPRIYRAFCQATSKGSFFQRYVRDRYDLVERWDELDQTAA